MGHLVAEQVADGRVDIALWPDEVVVAAAPDVIVFQRRVEDADLDAMERWKKLLPETLFVYELDDYLGEIPPESYHAGFMPPNIPDKVARGVAICDRTTTSTEPLAEWLRSLGAKDVRVVPNALPVERLKDREPRLSGKLRVGFAGGMSHSGDLALVEQAMEAIGDDVEWVFFGAKPDGAREVRIEYHEGTDPSRYMDVMARLDVDLMLAPLADNMFNRCKSNLRLVEAGAVGACAIAQDLEPYRANAPPAFGYATTPEDWEREIRRFMASKPAERRRSADALRSWVGRHHVLERLTHLRMDAWLPAGEKWKPRGNVKSQERLVVSSFEDRESLTERLPFLSRFRYVAGGLEKAAAEAIKLGSDLLWLRPATHLGEQSWNGMLSAIHRTANTASAVAVASDGINAFPKPEEWMPMSSANVACMERILRERLRGRRLKVAAPFGPCVLLSGAALGMLGTPDVAGFGGNEEQAILEWALRASMRDWTHVQVADAFASSLSRPPQVTQAQSLRLRGRGTIARLQDPSETISPDEREAIELELLASQWKGPRPGSLGFGTDYASWKALSDAKRESTIPEWTAKPPILKTVSFGSTAFAPFGWLIHFDDTVELDEDALAAFSVAISEAGPDVMVVYSDHETKLPDGSLAPEFKPDFDMELFLAQDYVTPVCAVRANQPFGDRIALFEHVLGIALKDGSKAFRHVPRTLGSVRIQAKPEEMAIDALQRQILIRDALGDSAVVIAHKRLPGCLSVVRTWERTLGDETVESEKYRFLPWEVPLVSIVIPTLGGGRLIQPCVATLLQHTDYPNFEVIVVQNGERREPELSEAILADPRVKVVRWEGKFNWSAINDWAIRFHSKGSYIVTMNDDVLTGSKTWLDAMMGHAVLPDVGVVGARLVHPSGILQHCGVVAHRGVAGHMHKGTQNGLMGHMGRAILTHEASAVTGACMLFSRRNFDAVDGFDETMPMNYNDTDFCLRLRKKGLRIVVESTAESLHSEGASRGDVMTADSLRRLARENAVFARRHPEPDPYWNPNMHFGLVHDGLFVGGGNADVLAWEDFTAADGVRTVLIVNDRPGVDGLSLDVLRGGDVAMVADLSGFTLTMRGPIPQNARPWDIRDPSRMDEGLKLLGVNKVVLRSLVGSHGAAPPVEALRCLAALSVPVEFDPIEEWMVRPVDSEGREDAKVFGSVERAAWEAAYRDMLPPDPGPLEYFKYEVTSVDADGVETKAQCELSTAVDSNGDALSSDAAKHLAVSLDGASVAVPKDAVGAKLYTGLSAQFNRDMSVVHDDREGFEG